MGEGEREELRPEARGQQHDPRLSALAEERHLAAALPVVGHPALPEIARAEVHRLGHSQAPYI